MQIAHNPSFIRQAGTMLAVIAAVGVVANFADGTRCALWAAGGGAAVLAGFALCSELRFREMERLSEEVDEVLHEGRRIDFSDYREGDIAILKNQLSKMVAALRDTSMRLEQEKLALADALADVSHQIRTPLTAMELMIPAIENTADAHERTRALRELEGMIDHVGWLVTALLKLAKVDAGAFRVQHAPVNAERMARDALAPLAVAMDLHNVTCMISTEKAPSAPAPETATPSVPAPETATPSVPAPETSASRTPAPSAGASFLGDAAWSSEALENVLKNCLENTPEGGIIRISISEDALACRIRVTDTGPGIAAEDLPHIFERFYRGKAVRRERDRAVRRNTSEAAHVGRGKTEPPECQHPHPQGFGIGLALAQSLVTAQGGTLRASNAPEGGARFDMTFPKLTV